MRTIKQELLVSSANHFINELASQTYQERTVETIVLDRNDKFCSRAGLAELRIRVYDDDPEGLLSKQV
jgi:hypothetical protein